MPLLVLSTEDEDNSLVIDFKTFILHLGLRCILEKATFLS